MSYEREGENARLRKVRRASDLKTASAPLLRTAERLPARARAGIGGQADLRYCACGGKRRDGKCVRGCDE